MITFYAILGSHSRDYEDWDVDIYDVLEECAASFRTEEYAKQAPTLLTFTSIHKEHTASMFRVEECPSQLAQYSLPCWDYCLTLKMEEACSSKTVVNFYLHYIPEDCSLQSFISLAAVSRGADKSLTFLISYFPICSTTKRILGKVKEVRTTKS
jgi:hypothetical protein